MLSDGDMLSFLDSSITVIQLCASKMVGLLIINSITSVFSKHVAQFVGVTLYGCSIAYYNKKLWSSLFFFLD